MKTFNKGGVHPEENKLTEKHPVQALRLPARVVVPLSQHMGIPAKCIVNKGDKVLAGDVIGRADSFISANVHSPVSGKVIKTDEIADAGGFRRPAVFIDVEGDEWLPGIDRSAELISEIRDSREEILEKIKDKGIVGMGGATFPSHIKLNPPAGKKAEILIINGVECEPYLTSDHRLMLEHGPELLTGIQILMKALGVDKAIIGIENNKPDAINHLTDLSSSFKGIHVEALKVKYPQGGEKQLIKALTGREVPSGALPVEVGMVVHNVGTAFAVYEAVQKNKPLIERIVTLTGQNVPRPGNYLVRLGTAVSFLLEEAGVDLSRAHKIIGGGPMMGKALFTADTAVVKATSGILVMESDTYRPKVKNCIRCSRCVAACPMGLEPYLLAPLSQKGRWEDTAANRIMDCIECGSCQYICPSARPLLDYVRLGKLKTSIYIRNKGR